MAKECGWGFEYIKKNFTLSQIKRYYEAIYELKMQDHAKMTEGMMYAMATAQGGMKMNKFEDYLMLHRKKEFKDAEKVLDEMKQQGLPIEDN